MRAFFDEAQRRHQPKQFMRAGVLSEPVDLPDRADVLMRVLERRGVAAEAPRDIGWEAARSVHREHYLRYLSSAYRRWSEIPGAGPEVLPNNAPYWNAMPGAPRPACPSGSIIAETGYYLGDLAVPVGEHTWDAALAATHVAAGAAEAVLAGENACYALCRPSGHHARSDRASGFCYLNNAAIAAQHLRGRFSRVAILDIDAHHGDGTQEIFYGRDDVMTLSVHADPHSYYPFYTGYAHERGHGPGEGFNLNLPLAPKSADDAFLDAISRACDEIAASDAEALVLSLGFDSHRDDPIGILNVTTDGFFRAAALIASLRKPAVIVQEGGYKIEIIGDCLDAFLSGYPA